MWNFKGNYPLIFHTKYIMIFMQHWNLKDLIFKSSCAFLKRPQILLDVYQIPEPISRLDQNSNACLFRCYKKHSWCKRIKMYQHLLWSFTVISTFYAMLEWCRLSSLLVSHVNVIVAFTSEFSFLCFLFISSSFLWLPFVCFILFRATNYLMTAASLWNTIESIMVQFCTVIHIVGSCNYLFIVTLTKATRAKIGLHRKIMKATFLYTTPKPLVYIYA